MFKKSVLLSILSLCTSFFSAFSQILFAKLFGSSSEFNSYLIASSIPFFISGTIVVAFNYSLTPILIKNNNTSDGNASSITYSMTAFALVISLIGYAASCLYYFVILNKSVNSTFILNLSLCYLFCFLQILIGYLKCLAESLLLFIVPFIATSLFNISVIVSCLVFTKSIGTLSIIGGYIIGIIIGLVIIVIQIIKNKAGIFSFSKPKNNEIFKYFRSFPLILVSMLTFTVFAAIDLIWVPSLGTSKLAYINYCQKIVGNLGVLIIAGPATLLTPYLIKQLSENTRETFLTAIEKSLRLALIFSLVPVIFVANYSHSITKLLLQRGNFNTFDTNAVASILPFFTIAIVPLVCVVIIFRALIVTGDILSCAKIGLATTISYFTFSGLLKIPLEVNGIGLSYLISWFIVLAFSIRLLWKKDLRSLISKTNVFFILKLFFICIVSQLFLSQMRILWPEPDSINIFTLLLYPFINFGLTVIFFVVLSILLRFEETSFLLKKIPIIKNSTILPFE